MILIADSGSTKQTGVSYERRSYQATWNERDQPFLPVGRKINKADTFLCHNCRKEIQPVFFWCRMHSPKSSRPPTGYCNSLPVIGNIKANSDMLAAAHGLCGQKAGIACIFGDRGPILVFTMEKRSSVTSPSPGFILGDEGSGAVLGKLLVGDILTNQLPATLKEDF